MCDQENSHLHCPRCGRLEIVVFEYTFRCSKCMLMFEIQDLELFNDDEILSIEEKLITRKEYLNK